MQIICKLSTLKNVSHLESISSTEEKKQRIKYVQLPNYAII